MPSCLCYEFGCQFQCSQMPSKTHLWNFCLLYVKRALKCQLFVHKTLQLCVILFLSCVSLSVFDLYCLQCFDSVGLGDRKGIRPVKNMGGWWRWALVSLDRVAPSRMIGVSASYNLPLHHNVQKFSSGTGSPGWSQKKGHKTVVLLWWWCVWLYFIMCFIFFLLLSV